MASVSAFFVQLKAAGLQKRTAAIAALKAGSFDVGIMTCATYILVWSGIWGRRWIFVDQPIEPIVGRIAPNPGLGTNCVANGITRELPVKSFQCSWLWWQATRSDADGAGII